MITRGFIFFKPKIRITQRNLNQNRKYYPFLSGQARTMKKHQVKTPVGLSLQAGFILMLIMLKVGGIYCTLKIRSFV